MRKAICAGAAVVLLALGGHSALAAPPGAAAAKAKAPKADKGQEKAVPEKTGKPAAGKGKAGKPGEPVATTTDTEGVKTYTFGAVEVESRLRSPQVMYFLRRVRAEFDSGALGHRSFLRELSDTRRHPAIR